MDPISPSHPFPTAAPPKELDHSTGRPSLCCHRWNVFVGLIGVGVANIYQPPIPWTTPEKIMLSCLGYMIGMHVGNGLYHIKEFCRNRY